MSETRYTKAIAVAIMTGFTTTSGNVTLHMLLVSFDTAIIEWRRWRESNVEEALIEKYLAGFSVRSIEDITETL